MKIDSFIRLLAGSMVLLSAVLTYAVNPAWLILASFVGLSLVQSTFTGFCPPSWLLRRLGWVDQNDVIHWGGVSGPSPTLP